MSTVVYTIHMLIGIEASRANRLHKTGVEWYAYRVIQEMKKIPEAERHSWLLYSNDPLAMGLEKGPGNWHERQLRWPPKYLWTQIRLSMEMLTRPPELLFVPAHVLPRFPPKRSVVTIHDVAFHHYPELYPSKQVIYHEWATKDTLKHSARVLVVSEFTKRELVQHYGADPNGIIVTHLGVDHERYKPLEESRTDAEEKPYALFVGRLERKKNIVTLIRSFTLWKERHPNEPLQLVLAGKLGAKFGGSGGNEIQEALTASSVQNDILLPGYISEEEKVRLLQRAFVYIQPSYYEGFGLPPLEAMACGVPVISSTGGSLPEVVGEGNALFFDPNDIEALEEHFSKVMDNSVRETLIEKGIEHAKRFTWKKTARETFDALTTW